MTACIGEATLCHDVCFGLSPIGVRRLVKFVVDHFGHAEQTAAAKALQEIAGLTFAAAIALVAAECEDGGPKSGCG